jgi:formylglycine-generating enzyme required for sulfatase activity
VTNAQYLTFVEATAYDRPVHWEDGKPQEGQEDHPLVNVTWHDAVAYCRWLTKTTGRSYRLPSEAEWEKAARGTDGRIYPWGDEPPDENRCNFGGNVEGTTPVGAYSPQGDSLYGCVDMAGNVWEWCATRDGKSYPYDVLEDEWSDDYLQGDAVRVLRGGSWFVNQDYARCAFRYWLNPGYRNNYIGFRLVSPI